MDAVDAIGLAFDLEPGLLVEFGHIRHPQNDRVRLRLPVQRPSQLLVGLVEKGLEQRRHDDGFAAAGGGGKGEGLGVIAGGELPRRDQLFAQLMQGVFLEIEQGHFHPGAPSWASWRWLIMKFTR